MLARHAGSGKASEPARNDMMSFGNDKMVMILAHFYEGIEQFSMMRLP